MLAGVASSRFTHKLISGCIYKYISALASFWRARILMMLHQQSMIFFSPRCKEYYTAGLVFPEVLWWRIFHCPFSRIYIYVLCAYIYIYIFLHQIFIYGFLTDLPISNPSSDIPSLNLQGEYTNSSSSSSKLITKLEKYYPDSFFFIFYRTSHWSVFC